MTDPYLFEFKGVRYIRLVGSSSYRKHIIMPASSSLPKPAMTLEQAKDAIRNMSRTIIGEWGSDGSDELELAAILEAIERHTTP